MTPRRRSPTSIATPSYVAVANLVKLIVEKIMQSIKAVLIETNSTIYYLFKSIDIWGVETHKNKKEMALCACSYDLDFGIEYDVSYQTREGYEPTFYGLETTITSIYDLRFPV